MGELLHQKITQRILGAAFKVHSTLGPGFLETVYEEALAHELQSRGINCSRQIEIPIHYDGVMVGKHRLDLSVEESVIVERKAIKELAEIHTAIMISYLTATNLSVGLLLNFAKTKLDFKRIVRERSPYSSAPSAAKKKDRLPK
jgi:GxxExxY protein